MLKFILRVFVVAVISFAVAYQIVNRGLGYLVEPMVEDLAVRTMRGQVYALHKDLDPVAPADRATFLLQQVLPHYGLELRLLADAQVQPTENEFRQIDTAGFLMRDDFETVVMPLPGEPRQWLEVKLPGDDPMDKALTWGAWIVLSLLLTATLLLLWALPVWRDMDALRNAALRMGQGDLGIRVRLSRIAGIRHIGETFNQMASRISALIENQRSMTNAVSHELRTPLARLSFELDLLAREEAAPKRGLIIQDMHADIEELQGMVAELLVYARLERPAEESVKLETVDTLDWLKEALALVAFQAEARNVQCHIQEGYLDHIDLHPRYMSRALLNMVQNAVRYADGHVHVSVTGCPEGGFQLIVDDDGPGIPAAERENIFEPFIRLDDSRDRGTGGAGLGLAIVKRVAASHNGSIEACASPLGGARFVLRWPAGTKAH